MSISLQKSIGFKLLRYVFGFYFIIAVLVTSVQLVLEYINVKESMFRELSSLSETLEDSLAKAIWSFDNEQIEANLLGISKIEIVAGAKVTNLKYKVYAAKGKIITESSNIVSSNDEILVGKGSIKEYQYIDKKTTGTLFEYKFPIVNNYSNDITPKIIGHGYIYTDHSSIIDRIEHGFILIIINSLIKTVALWFIFLYFTKRIIAKPIALLTSAVEELNTKDIQSLKNNNDLDKILLINTNNELNILINSFVKMRNAVIERTSTITEINKELKYLSLHDSLTGLPNRNLFYDRLNTTLRAAERDNLKFAIVSIDFRKFKEINDTYGHLAGDTVLRTISKRIYDTLYSIDTIARMGGDEFALILKGVDKSSIKIVGEKILSSVYEPILFESQSIYAGVNMGVSFFPENGRDPELLYKHADFAMYQAKREDSGLFIYNSDVAYVMERRDVIVRDLEKAIEKGQLQLFYQAQINGSSNTIHGVEALIRWLHPTLGYIPPDEFIVLAERSNMIRMLTDWVVNRALKDGVFLRSNNYDLNMSINLSGRLINDSKFISELSNTLNHYDFPSDKVTLEITETSAMKNPDKAIQVISKLKELGVKISIDDFGTGYSSFSYLVRLPIDELKIDKSFLLEFNQNSKTVIASIIGLAHQLGLDVVAEGVETEEMVNLVNDYDCDIVQGYHFCRPLPLKELIIWLETHNKKYAAI